MVTTNPKVDGFLRKASKWQEAYRNLRKIALDCDLQEDVKWRWPCYTREGANIVLIHGFKEHCALLFFKGALLKDRKGILVKPGENTQAGRQIRFTDARQVAAMASTIKAYIAEAIEVEESGLKVPHKETAAFEVPEEFQKALEGDAELTSAFEGLTPGRQRGYLLYFSSAKQAKTREARVEKYRQQILNGKGLDD